MKKTAILFLLALLMSWGAMSQTRILRCYSYAEKHKDYYGNWTEFSAFKETNFEIAMNFDAGEFTFFSSKPHHYRVLNSEGHEVDKDGDDVFWFYCVDGDGVRCRVRLYKLNSQEGRNQLYITFADLSLVYNVETIK